MTSPAVAHFRVPPFTHAASRGTDQLSLGQTLPPSVAMAAVMAVSSSGKDSASSGLVGGCLVGEEGRESDVCVWQGRAPSPRNEIRTS